MDPEMAVPFFTETVTLPVPAPTGTVAVSCVELASVTIAGLPLKNTLSSDGVELKPVPLMLTVVSYTPVSKLSEIMAGAGVGFGLLFFEQPLKESATIINN